jgi:hypothetical protein
VRAQPTAADRLAEGDVLDVAAAFDLPDLGDGLARLDAARGGALPQADALWLGERGRALELDRLGLRLDGAAAAGLAGALADAAAARDADALDALIDAAL